MVYREDSEASRAYNAKRSAAAWSAFRDAVESQGGTVLEDAWKGSRQPHRVRCAEGHEVTPRPCNVMAGKGICRTCTGRNDTAGAEARFRAAVESLGGTVLEGAWKGSHTPHRVRCAQGHEGAPHPSYILQGGGICLPCSGQVWDVFYVVTGVDTVKFGITSGDPRARLSVHRVDGLDQVLFLRTGLEDGLARSLELTIIHALKRQGFQPVRGREYFPLACAEAILSMAGNVLPDV